MSLLLRRLLDRLHLVMAVPALVLFALFFVYPLSQGIRISFTDWTGFSSHYHYIGLQNFGDFFQDDRAVHALKVTLIFGFASPLLLCLVGLTYALILDQKLAGSGTSSHNRLPARHHQPADHGLRVAAHPDV